MALTVPPPRTASPAERGGRADGPSRDAWARWYEEELGWATAGSAPVRLLTGLRFDALVVPAAAGHAALRRVGRTGPVTLTGRRMNLLVAPGSADELPGLLDWLEWGGVALAIGALGAGGRITAPPPPGRPGPPGAAVWLRPPCPPHEQGEEPVLPALSGFGSRGGDTPDLIRLVDAVATECHRARLMRARTGPRTGGTTAQPLAFS
ncbi:SCO3374 family protein [Streptomyces sp. NPDC050392]|uniref:SCO3374 family protein n=1 Tax=unclassified Streptomyces TaxID=2593676 RepID=UPI00341F2471|nr:SCO3374 family protein [Streptomyces sp. NBC_01104]